MAAFVFNIVSEFTCNWQTNGHMDIKAWCMVFRSLGNMAIQLTRAPHAGTLVEGRDRQ